MCIPTMSNARTIYKLQLIVFLNSVSFGLTYPFLSSYMLSLGADHVKIGILTVGRLICDLLSTDLIHTFKNGRMLTMDTFLLLAMLGHFPLIFAGHYWFVVLGRCICSVVEKQSQNLCKAMLLEDAEVVKKDRVAVFNLLSGIGYVTGPVIAGLLYGYGFIFIGLLTFFLTFTNLCTFKTISNNRKSLGQELRSKNVLQELAIVIRNCKDCNLKKNWDVLAIKFLHVSSVTIFCAKFSQVVGYNFEISDFAMGCIHAYISGLDFACTHFCSFTKYRHLRFSTVTLLDYCLKLLVVALLIGFYAPVYLLFMIMCIPVVLLNHFIHSLWKPFFDSRREACLEELNSPTKVAAGMTIPIIFGVLCNHIQHQAVIIFTVVPLIVSVFIITKYTKHRDRYEADKKIN